MSHPGLAKYWHWNWKLWKQFSFNNTWLIPFVVRTYVRTVSPGATSCNSCSHLVEGTEAHWPIDYVMRNLWGNSLHVFSSCATTNHCSHPIYSAYSSISSQYPCVWGLHWLLLLQAVQHFTSTHQCGQHGSIHDFQLVFLHGSFLTTMLHSFIPAVILTAFLSLFRLSSQSSHWSSDHHTHLNTAFHPSTLFLITYTLSLHNGLSLLPASFCLLPIDIQLPCATDLAHNLASSPVDSFTRNTIVCIPCCFTYEHIEQLLVKGASLHHSVAHIKHLWFPLTNPKTCHSISWHRPYVRTYVCTYIPDLFLTWDHFRYNRLVTPNAPLVLVEEWG